MVALGGKAPAPRAAFAYMVIAVCLYYPLYAFTEVRTEDISSLLRGQHVVALVVTAKKWQFGSGSGPTRPRSGTAEAAAATLQVPRRGRKTKEGGGGKGWSEQQAQQPAGGSSSGGGRPWKPLTDDFDSMIDICKHLEVLTKQTLSNTQNLRWVMAALAVFEKLALWCLVKPCFLVREGVKEAKMFLFIDPLARAELPSFSEKGPQLAFVIRTSFVLQKMLWVLQARMAN